MVLIGFVWLAVSFAVGYAGAQRGRGGVNWFLLALLLSPLLAVLVLLACPGESPTAPESVPSTWRIADIYRPILCAGLGLVLLVRAIGTALYSTDPLSYSAVWFAVGLSFMLGAAWLVFARRKRRAV